VRHNFWNFLSYQLWLRRYSNLWMIKSEWQQQQQQQQHKKWLERAFRSFFSSARWWSAQPKVKVRSPKLLLKWNNDIYENFCHINNIHDNDDDNYSRISFKQIHLNMICIKMSKMLLRFLMKLLNKIFPLNR